MTDSKNKRQDALLKLLEQKPLFSQQEICEEMQALGFSAAQPSISRDMKELNIIKISGRYLPPTTLSAQIPTTLTLSVHPAGANLIVIRTKTGAANAVAAQIDDLEVQGIVGSVAGDDTIFIAIDNTELQSSAIQYLKQFLLSG